MSDEVLSTRQTAAAVGYSYDWFKRIWRRLPGFPQPFAPGRWDAAAIAAWRVARSAPDLGAQRVPAVDVDARRDRAWAELERARRRA